MQPLSGNQRPDLLTALMNMSLVLRLPREMHLAISSAYVPRLPSFLKLLQNAHVLPERTKVLPTPQFFRLLTSKCASRHNGAHFFDISASKSGPNLVCFAHFDLEMCFATQRRALFRHLNVQKCSRTWCVLRILTWKCALRHNSVQLFISHLTRCVLSISAFHLFILSEV